MNPSVRIKEEMKEERSTQETFPPVEPSASEPGHAPSSAGMDYYEDGIDIAEPGALYTCGNCTKEIFLTAKTPMQCPSCEHLTGSSSVFYKIRTQATTYDTI